MWTWHWIVQTVWDHAAASPSLKPAWNLNQSDMLAHGKKQMGMFQFNAIPGAWVTMKTRFRFWCQDVLRVPCFSRAVYDMVHLAGLNFTKAKKLKVHCIRYFIAKTRIWKIFKHFCEKIEFQFPYRGKPNCSDETVQLVTANRWIAVDLQ